MTTPLKISVITACFNSQFTITEAITSLKRQSWPSIEHLLIDSASKVASAAIASPTLGEGDVLVSEPDRGMFDTLNKGLQRASGYVTGFLNTDDLLAHGNELSRVAACFTDTHVGAVYSDLQYVNADNTERVFRHWKSGTFSQRKLQRGRMPPHPSFFIPPNSCVRRSLVNWESIVCSRGNWVWNLVGSQPRGLVLDIFFIEVLSEATGRQYDVGPVCDEGIGLMSMGLTTNRSGSGKEPTSARSNIEEGGIGVEPLGSFRLARNVTPAGGGTDGHRSGWPYVVACLHERQSADGVLVDDFVEATFAPTRRLPAWKRLLGMSGPPHYVWESPWVGFFHLPPNSPKWFKPNAHSDAIFAEPRFRRSLPHLKGAVVFSQYTGAWIREKFGVPVLVAKHPTEMVFRTFNWDAFEANPDKQLVQIGWYLRNYRAIYQVTVPSPFRKIHIAQSRSFIEDARRRTDLHSPFRHRPDVGDTEVVSWLENNAYDDLLTRNVMFLELFDASANNAVIEAIARDTPVVVNRHPAVAEYLGADYPLFYDDLDEVAGLLEMPRIQAAHEHIRALDKTGFTVEVFIDHLERFVRDIC